MNNKYTYERRTASRIADDTEDSIEQFDMLMEIEPIIFCMYK